MARQGFSLSTTLTDVRLGLIPILLVPVIVSFWPRGETVRSAATAPAVAADEVLYYLKNARTHTLDEQGQLRYEIQSREILHFNDASTKIDKIHVTYHEPKGHWLLLARQGYSPPGVDELQLSGGVDVSRHQAQKQLLTMQMAQARLLPEARQLDTDSPVEVNEDRRQVNSTGMTIDLPENTVYLKSNVRVHYEP